jgi:hypothetical protein
MAVTAMTMCIGRGHRKFGRAALRHGYARLAMIFVAHMPTPAALKVSREAGRAR